LATFKKQLTETSPPFSWTYGAQSIYDAEAVVPTLVTYPQSTTILELASQIRTNFGSGFLTGALQAVPLRTVKVTNIAPGKSIAIARFSRKRSPDATADHLDITQGQMSVRWYTMGPLYPSGTLTTDILLPSDDDPRKYKHFNRLVHFLIFKYRQSERLSHPLTSQAVRSVIGRMNDSTVTLGGQTFETHHVVWLAPEVKTSGINRDGTANEYDVTWVWHVSLTGPWWQQHIDKDGDVFYRPMYVPTSFSNAINEAGP
jgi:hypothetical protein